MKKDDRGATDVLSSLPIIACCIFAVMVLVAAIGQSAKGHDGQSEIGKSCNALLEEALSNMTVRSEDGRLYLDLDWSDRAGDLPAARYQDSPLSSAIEVRLLGANSSVFALSGNLSSCNEVFSASAPVLFVSGGHCIPGEIVARVGH
jgi:hypothetical protein